MIAPEQERLTQLLDELASRTDGTAPADRLERVHRRARRTTQLRVVAAATVAAVVVVGAGALITRTGDVGRQQQPGAPSVTPTTTPPVPSSVSTPTTGPTRTEPPTPHPSRTLVPASSRYPAAGTCPYTTGTVVTMTLNPDVPMPRCVSLHPGQELRVVNDSMLLGSPPLTLTVRWADYPARTLHPGESTTYKDPAGSYLAVGVHRLAAAPLYGGQPEAEVWLH